MRLSRELWVQVQPSTIHRLLNNLIKLTLLFLHLLSAVYCVRYCNRSSWYAFFTHTGWGFGINFLVHCQAVNSTAVAQPHSLHIVTSHSKSSSILHLRLAMTPFQIHSKLFQVGSRWRPHFYLFIYLLKEVILTFTVCANNKEVAQQDSKEHQQPSSVSSVNSRKPFHSLFFLRNSYYFSGGSGPTFGTCSY